MNGNPPPLAGDSFATPRLTNLALFDNTLNDHLANGSHSPGTYHRGRGGDTHLAVDTETIKNNLRLSGNNEQKPRKLVFKSFENSGI